MYWAAYVVDSSLSNVGQPARNVLRNLLIKCKCDMWYIALRNFIEFHAVADELWHSQHHTYSVQRLPAQSILKL